MCTCVCIYVCVYVYICIYIYYEHPKFRIQDLPFPFGKGRTRESTGEHRGSIGAQQASKGGAQQERSRALLGYSCSYYLPLERKATSRVPTWVSAPHRWKGPEWVLFSGVHFRDSFHRYDTVVMKRWESINVRHEKMRGSAESAASHSFSWFHIAAPHLDRDV